jgi:hypothetical protein
MTMPLFAKLIVTDTGPLITLAAADCLDYLLLPEAPVLVPDAVLYEATADQEMIGAAAILDWTQRHLGAVLIVPTQVFSNFLRMRDAAPGSRERDLGERAAIEAVHDAASLGQNERAVMLTEDDRVLRTVLVRETALTQEIIPLTTRDFLEGLERSGRIQSADFVYERSLAAGRALSKRAVLDAQHAASVAAIEQLLARKP